jgi:hypothetical protein
VLEIAVDSGYRNLSLFNLLFKRQFGMTPSETRRQAKLNGASLGPTLAVVAWLVFGLSLGGSFDFCFSDMAACIAIKPTSGCHLSLFVFWPGGAHPSSDFGNRFTKHEAAAEHARASPHV